jgi:hypothetical protein
MAKYRISYADPATIDNADMLINFVPRGRVQDPAAAE